MTARVIDDPSALGWEYDPDTGRWTWGGGSGSGGGGGGSFPEAPVDGKQYGRQNAGWTEIVHTDGGGGGGVVTTADVQLTNPTAFAPSGFTTQEDANTYFAGEVEKIIADAPADSGIYGRQNNSWVAVPTGGGGGDLTGYATEAWVSANYQVKGSYAASNHTHNYAAVGASYTKAESDSKYELKGAGGGGDPFPWTGGQAEFISNTNGLNIKITAGGSVGPEITFVNTTGMANSKSLRSSSNGLEVINGAYNISLMTCNEGGVSALDFIATSDANLKDNITTAPQGILSKLKGREWNWKESGEKGSGVVAQELEAAGLEHLVSEDSNGNKNVAYNGLVAYLIEEVKALRDEIEAMK